MELKLVTNVLLSCRQYLLIVPYGIETKFLELNMRQGYLLIVPYGIET